MRYALAAVAALVACAPAGAATYTYSFTVPTAITSHALTTGMFDASFGLPERVQLNIGDSLDLTYNFEAPQQFRMGFLYVRAGLSDPQIPFRSDNVGTATWNLLGASGLDQTSGSGPSGSHSEFVGHTFASANSTWLSDPAGFTISGIHTTFTLTGRDPNVAGAYTYGTAILAVQSPIPEPATWALMLCGFGFVGYASRKRRPTFTLA